MEPTKVYPVVAVLSLVTVEYGGWALLTFISARSGQLNDFQTQFFRAGHAHAGVLLVPSLVYFFYLGSKTDFSKSTQWIVGAILLAGVLAQSGGFFAHLGLGEVGRASLGTRLTRSGALLIATALVILAVGIARVFTKATMRAPTCLRLFSAPPVSRPPRSAPYDYRASPTSRARPVRLQRGSDPPAENA